MRVRFVALGALTMIGSALLSGCASTDDTPAVEGELLASKQIQKMTYGELIGRGDSWVRGVAVCPYATTGAVEKAVGKSFDGITDLIDLDDAENRQGIVLIDRSGDVVTSYATSRNEVDFCSGSGSTRAFKASDTATVVKSTDDFTNFVVT